MYCLLLNQLHWLPWFTSPLLTLFILNLFLFALDILYFAPNTIACTAQNSMFVSVCHPYPRTPSLCLTSTHSNSPKWISHDLCLYIILFIPLRVINDTQSSPLRRYSVNQTLPFRSHFPHFSPFLVHLVNQCFLIQKLHLLSTNKVCAYTPPVIH